MSFVHKLQDLKNHSLIKIISFYLLTSWLVIQVAVTIFPLLGFPDWSQRLILIFLIAGFPITLILTWFLNSAQRKKEIKQAEETAEFTSPSKTGFYQNWIRPILLPFFAILCIVVVTISIVKVNQIKTEKKQIQWAYQVALPKIEAMIDSLSRRDVWKAFQLVQEVEKIVPEDPRVMELKRKCSKEINISTSPKGVSVYAKKYSLGDTAFQLLGITPIEKMRLPVGYISLQLEKEGYEPIRDVIVNIRWTKDDLSYTLDSAGALPPNMLMVRPHLDTNLLEFTGLNVFLNNPDDYFIDKYEVSNKEYLKFIKAGGYQNPKYWKEPIIDENGDTLSWQEAMSVFVDQTDQLGPSTWIGGSFPQGEEDFPVEGVSWYEAAAYAEFMEKQLPSVYHLQYLAGATTWIHPMIEKSHLNQARSRKRSTKLAEGLWGTHDILGNLREWCYNSNRKDYKSIVGASYEDEDYLANEFFFGRLPIDRSKGNGFRCIKSLKYTAYDGPLFQELFLHKRDYTEEQPIPDNQFKVYLSQFYYDKEKMGHEILYTRDEQYWTRQKVLFDAPVGNDKMIAYLFLPKNASPPYQTILYWPGAMAMQYASSEQSLELGRVNFLIKNGRAVVFPIISGTYERKNAMDKDCGDWRICDKRNMIRWMQEFQKTLDYLETRKDIDMEKVALLGSSWGANYGCMPLAVDDRFKAGILRLGGLTLSPNKPFPEVDMINYCARVTQPVLMLNGRFDSSLPYLESLVPMYDYLKTPEKDKYLKTYKDGHMLPIMDYIKECLSFLDKYFGKVEHLSN